MVIIYLQFTGTLESPTCMCVRLAYQLVTEQGPGMCKNLEWGITSACVFVNYCVEY